jgi:hypothetical protein
MGRPLCFVDASGGAFAAVAAAFARAAGHRDVIARARGPAAAIPPEIAAVLDEVGLSAPEVKSLDDATAKSAAEIVDVELWGVSLHAGEGELERLAAARIARDRIERRVDALGDPP